MNVQMIRALTLAAGLSLVAGAATAQTRVAPPDLPTATNLGYSAAPGYGYATRAEPSLTVMGLTGVEPKYPEATGSLITGQPGVWTGRAR